MEGRPARRLTEEHPYLSAGWGRPRPAHLSGFLRRGSTLGPTTPGPLQGCHQRDLSLGPGDPSESCRGDQLPSFSLSPRVSRSPSATPRARTPPFSGGNHGIHTFPSRPALTHPRGYNSLGCPHPDPPPRKPPSLKLPTATQPSVQQLSPWKQATPFPRRTPCSRLHPRQLGDTPPHTHTHVHCCRGNQTLVSKVTEHLSP